MAYIPGLVIGVLIAVAIYRNANSRAERYQRAPWGWPVALWTVLAVLFGLITALVYWFACSRQDRKARAAAAV